MIKQIYKDKYVLIKYNNVTDKVIITNIEHGYTKDNDEDECGVKLSFFLCVLCPCSGYFGFQQNNSPSMFGLSRYDNANIVKNRSTIKIG